MTARDSALIFVSLFATVALAGLTGCKQEQPEAPKASEATPATKGGEAVNFVRETESFSFTYEYPPEAANLPALVSVLDAERARSLAELETQAAEAQQDAKANDYPFNPHMLGVSWKVTGDNPTLLAMVAEISSFAGGAHGNTGYEALIWDKAANRRIALDAVFADLQAAIEPMRLPYCDALNAERQEKRGEYIGESDDMFNTCPPFSDLVLVPYAGGDGGFDRMMFIAGPYVAGPYAEGAYEISLAMPAATLDKVKPAYSSAFTVGAR